jgi:uncharacterized membrane protein
VNTYPEVVSKIVDDYLRRVESKLTTVPAHDRQEFLREIESHLYEAYSQSQAADHVEKILAVLRNFGEPADVVADRLAESLVGAGLKRKLPLQIMVGIVIAIFGIPLGFGGVAVLVGVLAAVAGVIVAYYATTGAALLVGAMALALGWTRLYQPDIWDFLIALGVINNGGPVGPFFDALSPSSQGLALISLGCVFVAIATLMLWTGKYLIYGSRLLFGMIFDWIRRTARRARPILVRKRDDLSRLFAPIVRNSPATK